MARRTRVIANLVPGHRYAFRVASIRFGGKYGAYSDPQRVDLGKPQPFVAPRVTAVGFPIMDFILVTWTGVGVIRGRFDLDEYRVYRTISNNASLCSQLDAKVLAGEEAVIRGAGGVETARVVSDAKALSFIDLGYEATKRPNGPKEGVVYYYWVRGIGKDGLLGTLSTSDNATLGPPLAITDLQFAEDTAAGFLWLKGWKVSWTPTIAAEGYYVQHRRVGGLWSPPHFVPHDTTVETQTHTLPLLVLGVSYEVRVKAVNHLILPKYQSAWYSETTTVADTTDPSPPTFVVLRQGLWCNKLAWLKPSDTDIAYFQVYKRSDDNTPTESDAVATVPATLWNHYWDLFAGKTDAINWRYYIKSVDWSNNQSAFSAKYTEGSPAAAPVVQVYAFIWCNFVVWNWELTDKHYDLYRDVAEPVTIDNDHKMKSEWRLPFFFDFGQIPNFGRVPRQRYFYAVKVTKMNLNTATSASTGGTPLTPIAPGDVDVNANEIIQLASANTVAGKVNSSTITLTPTSISLKSGGSITMTSGGSVGTRISAGTLVVEIAPTIDESGALSLGTGNKRWIGIYASLPYGSVSGTRRMCQLYLSTGGDVRGDLL